MTAKASQNPEELLEFNWDNPEPVEVLKVEKPETTDEEEVKEEEEQVALFEEVEEEEKKEKKTTTAPKSETPKGEKEEIKEEEDDDKFFSTLTQEFKEKKIFRTLEIKEDEEITEEKFFELAEEEATNRADEIIEAFMEELDEDGKAFLKFKKDGGSNADFLKVYRQSASIPEVDIKTEEGQNAILRYYYKNYDDMDEADIEDKLEWLAEHDKKESYAIKYNDKIKAQDKKIKEKLLKDQEKINEAKLKEAEKFVSSIKSIAESTDEIKGFKIDTKKEKAELTAFITKPSFETESGRTITGLQYSFMELFKKENHEKLLLLAKLLKNDFDFSSIAVKAKTETTKSVKEKLNSQKSSSRPSSQNSSQKSLTDYF